MGDERENYGVEKIDCPFQPIQRTSLESTVSGLKTILLHL